MKSPLTLSSSGARSNCHVFYNLYDYSTDEGPETKSYLYRNNSIISSLVRKYNLENSDDEKLLPVVEQVSEKLLALNSCLDTKLDFSIKVRKLSNSYKQVTSEFSSKMDKWTELREKNIRSVQNSVRKFKAINQTTAKITLVSSSLDLLLGAASLMQGLFHFNLSSTYPLAISVIGGLSITSSLFALSYSNQTIEDLIKDIRNEKYLLRDLEVIHRRGNWIDKEVQELFPHGIDLKLVQKIVLDADTHCLGNWKQHVLTAVILSNIKKDRKLFDDDKFLASAKSFAESTVAQIWINRMKMRKLLDEMESQSKDMPDRKNMTGNGVFINQAAVNLYPILLPLFFNSSHLQKMRFLCSCLAAITATANFSDSDDETFEDLKRTFTTLQEDYKHIKTMIENTINDYD